MAPPRRRYPYPNLLRWNHLRWILAGFVLVNLMIFVHVHTLTITSDNTIPIQIPKFGKQGKNRNQNDAKEGEVVIRGLASWNNSLFEGGARVRYYTSNLPEQNLWDYSTILPDWIKEYCKWHQETRKRILVEQTEKWKSISYYVVECSDDFHACGGTADRLGPLPFHIQMAASMHRLLLIRWTKPAPLETYLLPPVGGLDWRVPPWLWEEFVKDKSFRLATYEDIIVNFGKNPAVKLLRVKYQSHNHGQDYYNQNRPSKSTVQEEPTYAQVYHDLWRVCFTPAPAIADRIEEQMQLLGLLPGKYISIHIRALYKVDKRDDDVVTFWARNAIRCATSRFPISAPNNPMPMPFLFVSDYTYATKIASDYGRAQGIRLVHREHQQGQDPFHLEKAVGVAPEEFYDAFVDIYMIGMSRCTAYNMGGFGRLGSMIGYNSSCVTFLTVNQEKCQFSAVGRHFDEVGYMKPKLSKPLFLPPIEGQTTTGSSEAGASPVHAPSWNLSDTLSSYNLRDVMHNDPLLYAPFHATDSGENLWKTSETIPGWMKKYFRSHDQQRRELLNPKNWTSMKLLVMECLEGPAMCGGASGRLKPIPTMIRFAVVTNRFLLIHWKKPTKLEEFLLPPKGGVDWRVPEWLDPFLMDGETGTSIDQIGVMVKTSQAIVKSRFQAVDGGSGWYDKTLQEGETAFHDLFHDVWHVFFTPAPPVALRIKEFMDRHDLVPGGYSSAHVHESATTNLGNAEQIKSRTRNAVNCASAFRPGKPIYVASDSKIALESAVEYGISQSGEVVTRQHTLDRPLGLDEEEKVANIAGSSDSIKMSPPAAYYDTFIDAYLLAYAKCIFISDDDFGPWALLIGGDYTCTNWQQQSQRRIEKTCSFSKAARGRVYFKSDLTLPLFFEPVDYPSLAEEAPAKEEAESTMGDVPALQIPMANSKLQTTVPAVAWNYSDTLSSYSLHATMRADPLLYTSTHEDTNLWDGSRALPDWMKTYFQWHRQQREKLLNRQDWRSMNIFVMECLDNHERCGGTSDRLKPTPSMLRMAAMTNRFLLIHWRRPAKLEEFLLPPKGGIDWRVPDWLHPFLMETETGCLTSQIEELARSANKTVRAKYQSFDGGCGWYDGHLEEGETGFNELFQEVWSIFFTPAPPVAVRIKEFMDRHSLVPGKYAAAHIRALYALEHRAAGQTRIWTRNAVNCATKLRPGTPVFVASDSKISSAYAVEYGIKKNGKVVTHPNYPDPPLHLDKGENVTNTTEGFEFVKKHPPAAYYDTFIDVYLLAFAKCVFISKGGFGHWALLMGGNITCTMRQKKGKKGISNPCNWTDALGGINHFEEHLTEPLFLQPMDFA